MRMTSGDINQVPEAQPGQLRRVILLEKVYSWSPTTATDIYQTQTVPEGRLDTLKGVASRGG